MNEVVFEFPTQYQDTGPEGDKLWNDLMPCKSYPAVTSRFLLSSLKNMLIFFKWDPDSYVSPGPADSTCPPAKPSPRILNTQKFTPSP